MHDAQHWHDMELQNLGAVVGRLEAELAEIRSETEQQQQERAHLLACKSQLQKDVASYHALLDREENKYGHVMCSGSSLSAGRMQMGHGGGVGLNR